MYKIIISSFVLLGSITAQAGSTPAERCPEISEVVQTQNGGPTENPWYTWSGSTHDITTNAPIRSLSDIAPATPERKDKFKLIMVSLVPSSQAGQKVTCVYANTDGSSYVHYLASTPNLFTPIEINNNWQGGNTCALASEDPKDCLFQLTSSSSQARR